MSDPDNGDDKAADEMFREDLELHRSALCTAVPAPEPAEPIIPEPGPAAPLLRTRARP